MAGGFIPRNEVQVSGSSDLLELQAVDIEIIRAAKRLDELPEKRAILEVRAKEREVQSLGDKAGILVRKLESEIKARQDEATMIQTKLTQEQTKIMATSDHRAVQSITREMDGLKRRCDKLEMEELQYMERLDKARAQVAAVHEHLARLAEKEAALVARFKAVGGGLQREIAELEGRRSALSAAVDPGLVRRYEAAKAAKGGVGVGRLEGSMCSACRMELPAERLKELREGPEVGICPHCRRLLVIGEDAR